MWGLLVCVVTIVFMMIMDWVAQGHIERASAGAGVCLDPHLHAAAGEPAACTLAPLAPAARLDMQQGCGTGSGCGSDSSSCCSGDDAAAAALEAGQRAASAELKLTLVGTVDAGLPTPCTTVEPLLWCQLFLARLLP